MVETIRFCRGNLPHWLVADRTYFVTMRLNGTLPRSVVEGLRSERDALHDAGCQDEEAWLALTRRQFLRIDAILDAVPEAGKDWLTQDGIPQAVLASVEWLKTEGNWSIHAATVMSTHLHVVLSNRAGRSGALLEDLEKFKRFTGRAANRILNRTGRFWAREEFDHWCRTPDKVAAAVRYVRENPVKAGLVERWQDWPWTVGDWDADGM